MAIEPSRYDRLKKRDLFDFRQINIKSFVPTPEEFDYRRGYVTRYFTQKTNDKNYPIFEISSFTYNSLIDNPFYNVVQLNWRLTGNINDIKDSNFKSVKLASVNMPNLMMYLPNYLQFANPSK